LKVGSKGDLRVANGKRGGKKESPKEGRAFYRARLRAAQNLQGNLRKRETPALEVSKGGGMERTMGEKKKVLGCGPRPSLRKGEKQTL